MPVIATMIPTPGSRVPRVGCPGRGPTRRGSRDQFAASITAAASTSRSRRGASRAGRRAARSLEPRAAWWVRRRSSGADGSAIDNRPAGKSRRHMRRLCVFCGSAEGNKPRVCRRRPRDRARDRPARLGSVTAAAIGLMGKVADAVLAGGASRRGHPSTSPAGSAATFCRLHLVESMHGRKAMMADLADGFLAPGLGTLEGSPERPGRLGLHQKPCALLDVAGCYAPSPRSSTTPHRGLRAARAPPPRLMAPIPSLLGSGGGRARGGSCRPGSRDHGAAPMQVAAGLDD
jgi:predicted Rossmann-fold nucleotide-binding protein